MQVAAYLQGTLRCIGAYADVATWLNSKQPGVVWRETLNGQSAIVLHTDVKATRSAPSTSRIKEGYLSVGTPITLTNVQLIHIFRRHVNAYSAISPNDELVVCRGREVCASGVCPDKRATMCGMCPLSRSEADTSTRDVILATSNCGRIATSRVLPPTDHSGIFT